VRASRKHTKPAGASGYVPINVASSLSHRSAYDSAIAKFEKLQNGKKEKDRREAEEEMERARQR